MLMLFAGLSESAAQVVRVKPNNPKHVTHKPHKVKHGHVWVNGHHRWDGKTKKYVWVRGHQMKARAGHAWVPGHWSAIKGKGHKWGPGHWKRK